MVDALTSADLLHLRHLVDSYADAVDRLDEDAFRALFTEDGALRVQPDEGPTESEWTGRDVVASFDLLRPFHRTFHHVGGAVFDVTPEGASGRVHCVAHHYQRTTNGPVDLVMMIRYHDRYLNHSGVWQISDRRVAIEWTELLPAHPVRRARR